MSSPPLAEPPPRGRLAEFRRRLKAPRQLSLTRAGKFFLLITLAIGFGAINTGNNLLFLLFGMMLSLILASGILSEAVIRNVRLRRRLPRRLHASEPAPGRIRILNKGFWPALSIVVSEQNPQALSGPLRGQTLGPSRIPWWKFWRRQTDQDSRLLAAAYCLRADGAQETLLDTHYNFTSRGRFHLPGLAVTTRFPFGLFEKSREFDAPVSLLVYPCGEPAAPWVGMLDARHGETSKNRRGDGEEFFGLRQYRPGEDRRSIHWKSTARRGEPVVREFESRERRALAIILDNRAPAKISPGHSALFEQGLRRLTGLLQTLQARGYRIELLSCDGQAVPQTAGDIEPILAHLAEVQLHPPQAPSPLSQLEIEDPSLTRIFIGFGAHRPLAGSDLFFAIDELSSEDWNHGAPQETGGAR